MNDRGMQKVCCLLCDRQLARYSNLLSHYQQEFGMDKQSFLWGRSMDSFIAIEQFLNRNNAGGQTTLVIQ